LCRRSVHETPREGPMRAELYRIENRQAAAPAPIRGERAAIHSIVGTTLAVNAEYCYPYHSTHIDCQ
jgi:hypothetical protein